MTVRTHAHRVSSQDIRYVASLATTCSHVPRVASLADAASVVAKSRLARSCAPASSPFSRSGRQVALRRASRRRGAAAARLFLPSVHCGTVTGAKMADNREEISELVEKRGICRRVAPLLALIASRRVVRTSSDARVASSRPIARDPPQLHVARRANSCAPMRQTSLEVVGEEDNAHADRSGLSAACPTRRDAPGRVGEARLSPRRRRAARSRFTVIVRRAVRSFSSSSSSVIIGITKCQMTARLTVHGFVWFRLVLICLVLRSFVYWSVARAASRNIA